MLSDHTHFDFGEGAERGGYSKFRHPSGTLCHPRQWRPGIRRRRREHLRAVRRELLVLFFSSIQNLHKHF